MEHNNNSELTFSPISTFSFLTVTFSPLLGTHFINCAVQWQQASAEQIMGPVINLVLLVTFSQISLLTVIYSLTWKHFWESKHSQTQHSLRHIAAGHGQHCRMPGLSSSKGIVQWEDKWHHLVFCFNNGRHLKALCHFVWVFVGFLLFFPDILHWNFYIWNSSTWVFFSMNPCCISRSWGLQELIYSYRVWKLVQGKQKETWEKSSSVASWSDRAG